MELSSVPVYQVSGGSCQVSNGTVQYTCVPGELYMSPEGNKVIFSSGAKTTAVFDTISVLEK